MISVNNISVGFGGSFLYEDVSFLINPRDRIGLAGKNGAGKSTLLGVLTGEQRPQKGEVSIPNGCTIGYLPQDMKHSLGKTVYDETATSFKEIKALEHKIADINHQLETRTDYESKAYMDLITQLNDSNDRFNLLGGYTITEDIELILQGLGFERSDFTRLTDEFSGGWRMRIELAKILLQRPNIMLLDEPTNHLDIESIQWLEEFLKTYNGAVVMVSHDKAFLDAVTSRTIEISMGQIFDYKANYSKYLELRKERKEQQEAAAKNQQKYIEKTELLINKFRAKKDKAAFAQSLIKKLDKLEVIEVDDDDNAAIRFLFPPAPRSGKIVVEAKKALKRYGEKVIFHDVDFVVERGDRIAFVGKNGEGKSTMSRLIAREITGEGEVNIGFNINMGYYAQNQAEILDGELTVFETIDNVAVGEVRKNVRGLLGAFLFRGDDIDKKVKVLSGGEKSRLAMCKLLLNPHNLLVLDEPTNHLDLRSKDVLKNALMRYDGTLIIVSHDRDFLQGLTNRVFEFRSGNVKQHIGDVNEYLNNRKIASLAELNMNQQEKKKPIVTAPVETNADNELKKQKEKELKNLQNQVSKSEKEIGLLENLIKEMDTKLLDPEQYKIIANDPSAFKNYEDLKKKLEAEMKNWEALSEKLNTL